MATHCKFDVFWEICLYGDVTKPSILLWLRCSTPLITPPLHTTIKCHDCGTGSLEEDSPLFYLGISNTVVETFFLYAFDMEVQYS